MQNDFNIDKNNGNIAGVNKGIQIIFRKRINVNPSYIKEFVQQFAKKYEKMKIPEKTKRVPFDIQKKILYNNLKSYKDIVDKFIPYQTICDGVLNKLDNTSRTVQYKRKCLMAINDLYINVRNEFCKNNKIDRVECLKYGDDLLDLVLNKMITNTPNDYKLKKVKIEDRDYHIKIFMIYCFLECHILEKPKNVN